MEKKNCLFIAEPSKYLPNNNENTFKDINLNLDVSQILFGTKTLKRVGFPVIEKKLPNMKFLNVCKTTKETLFKGVLSNIRKEPNSQGRREGITNMHQLSKKKWRKNLGNSLYRVQLSLHYRCRKKLPELGEILLKKKRKKKGPAFYLFK